MNTRSTFKNWTASFLHFRELQWVLTSKKGHVDHAEVWEEQACSLGGLHILLHVYAHSVTNGGVMVLSVLCWMVPGCGIWGSNSPVPGLADLTASPASPNRPFLHFSVADSTEEAKSTNRQQCFAEGKRVREVKVNNIPCSLQWARDCWTAFSVSLKRKRKSREPFKFLTFRADISNS